MSCRVGTPVVWYTFGDWADAEVRDAVVQRQLECTAVFVGDKRSRPGERDVRFIRTGHVGEHDAAPFAAVRSDVLDVKDEIAQVFVEDPRFHLE